MKLTGLSTVSLALFFTFAQTQAQVTIGHITIVDAPGIRQQELDKIAHEVEGRTSVTNFARGFIADEVLEAFHARGYFRATVVEPELKPSTAGRTDADVAVIPGPQYLTRDIEFRFGGQPVLLKAGVLPLVVTHAGTVFNIRDVRKTAEDLQQYYVEHGYPKAVVMPQMIVNDYEHLITVEFDIQPQG